MDHTKNKHSKSRSAKRKLYGFLHRAGIYLLIAFSLSLLINAIVAGYYGYEKLTYKVEVTEFSGQYLPIDLEKLYEGTYKTKEEHQWIEERANLIETIGITALLGWMGVHPGFKSGIKRLIYYLKGRLG